MSLRDDFIVFGAPDIQQPEIDEVVECLESRWLGTGPKVAALERAFAEYKGRCIGTFGDFGCFSFYVTKDCYYDWRRRRCDRKFGEVRAPSKVTPGSAS